MRNFVKKQNGITLIALVVTIIVLLILAGVSIATLTGDNGILTQATRAKEESEKADIIEQIQLDIADKQIENQGSINEDDFYEILGKYGTVSADETILTTTKGNYEILISDIYGGEIVSSLVTTPLSSWEYTINNNNITLNRYIGQDANILIPETFTIDNISYNTVLKTTTPANNDGPFAGNNTIVSVDFEDGVYASGYGLFSNCSNLKKVYHFPTLSNNLRYIFNNCYSLTSFPEIPEGTKYLDWAFSAVEAITSAPTVPSSVETMIGTFSGCLNLTGTIEIVSENINDVSDCFNSTKKEIILKVPTNTTTYNTFLEKLNTWANVAFYGNEKLSIVCWGDSLTAGAGGNGTNYVSALKNLCQSNVNVVNMGVGGEDTITIAGRQGGIPMIVNNFVIPSDTQQVEITITSKNGGNVAPAIQSTNGLNPCYINGIRGNLSYDSNQEKYYFARAREGTAITVQAGTEIITEGMNVYSNPDVLILWTGTNDNPNENEINNVIEEQKAMIEYANTDKYVVLSLLYNGDDVNSKMSEAYGEHFLDVRNALSTDNSNTVSEDYKSDSVHLNADGYTIVGEQVYNKLISLGYISE